MKIGDAISSESIADDLSKFLEILHKEGPVSGEYLERLSYYKEFHSEEFYKVEERVISALGLFYKIKEPGDMYSFLMSGVGNQHKADYGEYLTPVQASVRRAVEEMDFVSISAPTSAGKSYSIRDFIADQDGDAVVVVPSRALIAEYVGTMRRKFDNDKNVMISSFVDCVFTSRELRRIFVLTPERARDLFQPDLNLNVQVFFFDEAQASEEENRGVIFDVVVRRTKENFPHAKIIFAHPFVDNPEAQILKHNFSVEKSFSRSYTHGTVGKICVFQHAKNKKYYYFSPFDEKGHQIKNCIEYTGGFDAFAFGDNHSVLVYVSKAKIYNGKFINSYEKYIEKFEYVDNSDALNIINTIEELLGANKTSHFSNLVNLLKKGVVIHHGSVPLEVRFLVEDFIRGGHSRICFATSTLAQGVNMPFDVVWLDSMRFFGEDTHSMSLGFKNLLGRSGRLTDQLSFDYGYVFTRNPRLFSTRINDIFRLNEKSIIDIPVDEYADEGDDGELLNSIRNGTFDDDLHVPLTKAERLSSSESIDAAKNILNIIFRGEGSIRENLSGNNNKSAREDAIYFFKCIFEISLDRDLYDGESAVFNQAISIFLQVIQGRSFKEIVGTRYSYISRRDEGRKGDAKFSMPAETLPDSKLVNIYTLLPNILAKDVSYDAIVFDTYDYLDKVISFSLSDIFVAAFKIYRREAGDERADIIIDLFRYGTNDETCKMLIRYGFPPEDVVDIEPYVERISEVDIEFKNIGNAPNYIKHMIEWYLP